MPIRFEPIGEMHQELTGRYVTHDDYEELKKELLEAAIDCISKVGSGELSVQDANNTVNVLARMITA